MHIYTWNIPEAEDAHCCSVSVVFFTSIMLNNVAFRFARTTSTATTTASRGVLIAGAVAILLEEALGRPSCRIVLTMLTIHGRVASIQFRCI